MSDVLISISSDAASDSWGFVGVVSVGAIEAYRTLESFPTPDAASEATQKLVASMLGELLAGREWGVVREQRGAAPTRKDFNFSAMRRSRPSAVRDQPGTAPRDERGGVPEVQDTDG